MLESRALPARRILQAENLDAILFWSLPNIRYLTGFTGTDGAVVVTADAVFFLTDSRYTTQAKDQVRASEVREYKVKLDGIVELLGKLGAKRVGFEGEIVPVAVHERLQKKSPDALTWVTLGRPLTQLRALKDQAELEKLGQAARWNAEALEDILPLVRPGAREQEIAFELELALRRRGGEEKAFDFIVASGERGAMPHGLASDKILKAGELVTIDFGTRFQGYHSDETVTLALGEVSEDLRRIYDCVLKAHDLAMAGVAPGASLKEIDAIARDHIAACGYGDFFGHGLGHGVGLEVHEYPTASPRSEDRVEEGMVFTIEPGIYIPGLGGVRIEDMVVATKDGCRPLTRIPKDFRILPV